MIFMEKAAGALKTFWRWFITPPSTSKLLRRTAWSLWLIPPLMMSPLWVPLFLMDPKTAVGLAAEVWPVLVGFIALPALIGFYFWRRAERLDQG